MKTSHKLLMTAAMFTFASAAHAQNFCVFDPLGSSGDNYSLMKDYALVAKQWGADITLKPYTDEKLATNDFKSGKCDSVAITGIRARTINEFIGTISSPVGVINNDEIRTIMTLVGSPKLASDMVENDAEVAGVSDLGFAYIMVRDRRNDTIPKLAALRFGVLSFDKIQSICVDKFGGTPVPYELDQIGSKFNSAQVDAVLLPAVAFKPLELNKGLGTQGAIFNFPVALTTLVTLIHPAKFPDGYGQKSRTWFAGQVDRQIATVSRTEKSIDPRYWGEVPSTVAPGYIKILRESRISLTKEGLYSKKMAGILKKVRCRQDPNNFECPLNDE